MTDITARLFALREEAYGDFQYKLTPGFSRDYFIGVRIPLLRAMAKELKGTEEAARFLEELPHTYYEENMLHGLLLSQLKDDTACLRGVEEFLPYVDNWAVCDTLSPKVFGKHKSELLERIRVWAASDRVYTCRFGIAMLMRWYLDGDFRPEYLEIPAAVTSEEYYVRMMQAWYYATALAKQWEATVPYLENRRLEKWVHNKTIQKARESYRITEAQKEYLTTLRWKQGAEHDD